MLKIEGATDNKDLNILLSLIKEHFILESGNISMTYNGTKSYESGEYEVFEIVRKI